MTPEQRAVIEAARALVHDTINSPRFPTLTALVNAVDALDTAPHNRDYGVVYAPCLNERPHEAHAYWFPGDPDTGQRLSCPGVCGPACPTGEWHSHEGDGTEPKRCPECGAGPFAIAENLAGHVGEAHRVAPACTCKPHKIFGHADDCRYVGMGALPPQGDRPPADTPCGTPECSCDDV